jgi:hypothetical protein
VEARDQYLRWPSEAHAKRLGAPTALADASPDQSALELGEPAQDGEWPAAIIVAATCVRHNGHRGRSSALLLAAIMHGVAHFSGLLSERVLVVRPAGSV